MEEEDENEVKRPVEEAPARRRHKKVLFIPRRAPSVVIPPRKIIYPTPDKTTCAKCTCFPKEDPYVKPKKINPCQKSPDLLYELAARVVDSLKFPAAFNWTEAEVADWMADVVGLPDYRECIIDNHINGLRLLLLEDPSHMPAINIGNINHILTITAAIRKEYGTEFIKFTRSIGLPPRKPLTHCTWFKSRTGPTWGVRQNWSRCDILRWMKILNPEPIHMDHWDLVWYTKPDFPIQRFARLPKRESEDDIPHYVKLPEDICTEYMVPRKFRLQMNIPERAQMIWMEHRPGSPFFLPPKQKVKKSKFPRTIPKKSRLDPPPVDLTGLKGKALILARRKLPTPKFMANFV